MPNVNFYLKNPSGKVATLILLQMKYKGQRLVYSTGESVRPSQWNKKKQRVKNISATTKDGKHNLNDLLKSLEEECIVAYNSEIKNGIPSPQILKRYLDKLTQPEEKQENKFTLLSFIEFYIKQSIELNEKATNTIKKYGTLLTYLRAYNSKVEKIDFESIDLNFFYNYLTFLKTHKFPKNKPAQKVNAGEGLKQNSIAKSIAVLKAIMNEAVDRGLTDNLKFKHKKFSYAYEEIDAVYLKEAEIEKLFKYDLSGNEKLERVRDLFVFGCWTGLRYGDYSNIKPENIIEQDGELFIRMTTQKTKHPVIIPCHPMVLKIFEKYKNNSNRLPRAISSQNFNDYIKVACEKAGLNEANRLETEPGANLYQCVSSHTARRSFCSNLYLQGFPVIELMKISGHNSERAFLKYIRVTKLETAKKLSAHYKQIYEAAQLKVVA